MTEGRPGFKYRELWTSAGGTASTTAPMKLGITSGTLWTSTPDASRYEERTRVTIEVPETATISDVIAHVDHELPATHPGHSYLSLETPHGPLSEDASLHDLNIPTGATLRRFSYIR